MHRPDRVLAPRPVVSRRRAEWLLWLFPLLYLLEVILGGPVSVIRPLRYLLFVAAMASLLAAVLWAPRMRRDLLWPVAVVWSFLLFNLIWATIVPMLQGTDLVYAMGEAKAYLALGLVILFVIASGGSAIYLRRLQQVVVYASVALAIFQVLLWLLGTLIPALQIPLVLGLRLVFSESLYVGIMPDGFFRVFWISSLWLLLALFWSHAAVPAGRARWLVQAVLLMGVFVSYARGMWLGLLVGLLVAHMARVVRENRVSSLARRVAAAGLILLLVTGGLAAAGQLDRGMNRLTSSVQTTADESVSERVRQTRYLFEILADHPFLGAGYGAYSNQYIRDPAAPYSYENMPYALLAKLGIVGMSLFVGFFLLLGSTALSVSDPAKRRAAERFCGSLVAFLVAAMTNPMLLNFVGLSILGCLLAEWSFLMAGRSRGGYRL